MTNGINNSTERVDRRREVLLLVYEKTHDSAEHAEAVGWEATSIIWGSILLLLGFVIEALASRFAATQVVILCSAALAVTLVWVAWGFMRRNVEIIRHKYELCRSIETTVDFDLPNEFRQHTLAQRLFEERGWLGRQIRTYMLVSVFFSVIWIIVLLASAHNLCKILARD
jgi:hypothetical protein